MKNNSSNDIEILAPAGGKEQLIAAINAGADAVYIGAQNFNARQNATNFLLDDIKSSIILCHKNGVKLYGVINILITDREMNEAFEVARFFYENGADGLIIQDEGLASYIKKYMPDIKLIASTQMAISNYEGLKRLAKCGFQRVVLARELSLNDIEKIANSVKNDINIKKIELEVFCHGALCMSVSGRCYMSAMIGRRSGNRGKCAQPCRLPYFTGKSSKNSKYMLSLKDLSALKLINKLAEIGVSSLKIEGRMKSPEYVYEVVKNFNNAKKNKEFNQERLKKVFSRDGFTNGYLDNNTGHTMFGIRTEKDKDYSLSIREKIDYKQKNEIFKKEIVKSERKINPQKFSVFCKNISKKPDIILSFEDINSITKKCNKYPIYLSYESAILNLKSLSEKNIKGIILPKLVREENYEEFLKNLIAIRNKGVTEIFGGDFGSIISAQKIGYNVNADYTLNIYNSRSMSLLKEYNINRAILSIELNFSQIRDIDKSIKSGIVGYGKTQLMTFRNCVIKDNFGCINGTGFKRIYDRKNEHFLLKCGSFCSNHLYNGKPICISDLDQYKNIGLDFIRLDFTDETQNDVDKIINLYENNLKPNFDFTRGLYLRGVL